MSSNGLQEDEARWLDDLYIHSDVKASDIVHEAVANLTARLESYNRLPSLRQLPDPAYADGEDIVWVLVRTRANGTTTTELRTEVNYGGGVCDCCTKGPAVEHVGDDAYVTAYEVDLKLPEGERERHLLALERQEEADARTREIEAEQYEEMRARVRERGTPVLDKLKARKKARREDSHSILGEVPKEKNYARRSNEENE